MITGSSAISIHAPAKGATWQMRQCFIWQEYFNPRSREGSDIAITAPKNAPKKFQSTLPRRERLDTTPLCSSSICISIHAPAKGATCLLHLRRTPVCGFQSTLPRRERRRKTAYVCRRGDNFNPRSREGSDYICLYMLLYQHKISIHAPAKGATMAASTPLNTDGISIHAPAKGATVNQSRLGG